MKKKTSGRMVNKGKEVAKVAVVHRGWQARRVGKTQPTLPQEMREQLIHLPTEKQLTLPQGMREQLIQ